MVSLVHKTLSPIKLIHNEKLEALCPGHKAFSIGVMLKPYVQDLSLYSIQFLIQIMDISMQIMLSGVVLEIRLNASESTNFGESNYAKT